MGVGRSSSLRTTADRSPLHDVRQPAPRDRGSTRYKFKFMDEHLDFPSTSIVSHDQPLLHSKSLKTWLGGARRDRTDDLLLAKQALSQLSYGPGQDAKVKRLKEWWAWEDSNFRPHAYQARALTN